MTEFSEIEFGALLLSFQLAGVTVLILLIIGIPIAKYLAFSKTKLSSVIQTFVAMPLILPPTVLGFYLLQLMGNNSWPGQLFLQVTGQTLVFSFAGLVVASVIYSLPFVVQPLTYTFRKQAAANMPTARALGANDRVIFKRIILPLSKTGIANAAVLGFAHTLGEFGVILMIGGNIPGETRVVSIAIYDQVESLNYLGAHILSAILLVFSFLILWFVYRHQRIGFEHEFSG